MERRECEISYDMSFEVDEEGNTEMCHHTGYEAFIYGEWWNEYVDSTGNLHYGR